MVTKDLKVTKMCLFCASEYHLEMILMPYLNKNLDKTKFVILTEDNLEATVKVVLKKLNITDELKKKIWNLNWKNRSLNEVSEFIDCNTTLIINGKKDFIENINKELNENFQQSMKIINCFHVSEQDIDIEEISKEYSCILNTEKM